MSNALDNINHNYFTAFLLLDLKIAFDTVDHVILRKQTILEFEGFQMTVLHLT